MSFFLLYLCFFLLPYLGFSLNHELLSLQQARLALDDPSGTLSDWNPNDDSPCHWHGITCNSDTASVIAIDLFDANVAGPFPLSLCRLPNLSFLSLYDNFINTTLPDDISLCRSLEHLDLAQNLFTGSVPKTLAYLPNLRYLDLSGNNFTGDISPTFAYFRKLEILALYSNLFNGTFPTFLTNISTLKQLNLSYNPFKPSLIPSEIGNLTDLEILWLSGSNLVGRIPDSIGRLKKLTDFDVALNNLEGAIPSSLTELTSIVQIELYNNSLTEVLPSGFSNLTRLRLFDASLNLLSGKIPEELCGLPLESLKLYWNQFEGELPGSIANSPNLYDLVLFSNGFSGQLPMDLGKNSPLVNIDFSSNSFSGEIPGSLCEKGTLEQLITSHNSFSGPIPQSLGDCHALKRVRISYNHFSGEMPAGLWGLPRLFLLDMVGNFFSGGIAPNVGAASNLSILRLSNNNFTGNLPREIGQLRNLVEFSGDDNQLSGVLPATIVKLVQLTKLDLHNNRLQGCIPAGIQSLSKLNELNLANNGFWGNIPEEIGSLSVLNFLDLSDNMFSGKIPIVLQEMKLNQLNLSNNRLSGAIPPIFTKSIYNSSFLGNPNLCADLDGPCDSKILYKNRGFNTLHESIFVLLIALVFLAGVACFYHKYRKFKAQAAAATIEIDNEPKWTFIFFHKLDFTECEVLSSLDEDSIIGSGGSGKVYKSLLGNGDVVAVKKIQRRSNPVNDHSGKLKNPNDGFEAEVKTLGKIRHKNIVKLLCCGSMKGYKLLVYEYMENGSLGDLLHTQKSIDWQTRFRIAVDAAEGLSYLHHDCVPPIVHRDVKSNNILVDGDFRARIADFGVAKAVNTDARGAMSMSAIIGSRGYIAPEYGYTLRIDEKSDIYSFGVVLLELVTGRRPTDPEFGDSDLVKWVCGNLEQLNDMLDPKLDVCFKEEVFKVLNIGLMCTALVPAIRPSMRMVVKMLRNVDVDVKIYRNLVS